MKNRRYLVALLTVLLIVASIVPIGIATAAEPEAVADTQDILQQIPAYTHAGTLIKTYDTGAEGQYYDKKGAPVDAPVVDSLGGGKLMVYGQVASDEGFRAYENDLKAAGYLSYADNKLDANLFSTWVNEEYVVTLSYLPGMKQLTILVEPMRALPGLEYENVYQNLEVENKVVLLTCGYIGRENGMCVIYQLCDGSFIIVDSGFGFGYDTKAGYEDHWQNQAKEIYSVLQKMSVESGVNKITVAAWFFSHPHWDHIGGFIPFADLYADQVKLEKVIFNWPNYNSMQEMITKAEQKMNHYIGKIEDAVAKFDGAVMVEAHAGQTYYIRDAVIDVLLTWEQQTQVNPNFESVNEGNSISQILDVKLGCERIIMMGDCGVSANTALDQLYTAAFMESDFLQIAHHGYNPYTKPNNDKVNPDVVLWTNDVLYQDAWLNNFSKEPGEVFYHNRKITLIPLPYTGEENVIYWTAQYPFWGA